MRCDVRYFVNNLKHRNNSHSFRSSPGGGGFTIVELLVVIVVIGILAAITIVAYNSISSRASVASLQSDLTNASNQLKLFQVDNGIFPTTIDCSQPDSITNKCVKASGGVSYKYTESNSNPQQFCITATKGSYNYKVTQDNPPVSGICPITNMLVNPSFETDTVGWSASLATITRIASAGPQGSAYLQAVRASAGDAYFTFILSPSPPLSTPYTLSFWIWADSPVTLVSPPEFRHYTGTTFQQLGSASAQVTTTPTRIIMSGLTNATGSTGGLQFVGRLPATIGVPVYYDGFMITQGLMAYTYADGNSSGWSWNGTVNNSTSTGIPSW